MHAGRSPHAGLGAAQSQVVSAYHDGMSIRRAFYHWLIPAAIALPLWLVVGWAVFNAASAPWAVVPVLLIFAPSVFVGQLLFAITVRVRPSVRETRMVSWQDVVVFSIWHLLTIAVGFYSERLFAITLVLAILAGIGVAWSSISQLWRESKAAYTPSFSGPAAPAGSVPRQRPQQGAVNGVIVLQESETTDDPSDDVQGVPGAFGQRPPHVAE